MSSFVFIWAVGRENFSMSNIAKIFIVINFVLSILFLGFAATLLSQKWDYRQMYLETSYRHELQKQRLEENLRESANRLKSLNETIVEAKKTTKETKEENIRLSKENDELKRKNQEYSTTLASIGADIREINNRLDKKEDQITALESAKNEQQKIAEEAKKAKEEAQDEQQRMEIQLSNLNGELADKEKQLQLAGKELLEARQIIRAVREAGINIPSLFKKSKPLDGTIIAVSNEVPLVMISLGTDEGVEKGYQFTVYRGSQFIGQIVVEEVYKDMSAARVVKQMTVKSVQKGDSITTRIGGGGSF